mmetsp:Transcript_33693/g.84822  ORF Transcript_33693/g.84822 Transcript_33693/m.84822 type:complete len:311 (-) Transcript_33693:232-1164(-)
MVASTIGAATSKNVAFPSPASAARHMTNARKSISPCARPATHRQNTTFTATSDDLYRDCETGGRCSRDCDWPALSLHRPAAKMSARNSLRYTRSDPGWQVAVNTPVTASAWDWDMVGSATGGTITLPAAAAAATSSTNSTRSASSCPRSNRPENSRSILLNAFASATPTASAEAPSSPLTSAMAKRRSSSDREPLAPSDFSASRRSNAASIPGSVSFRSSSSVSVSSFPASSCSAMAANFSRSARGSLSQSRREADTGADSAATEATEVACAGAVLRADISSSVPSAMAVICSVSGVGAATAELLCWWWG